MYRCFKSSYLLQFFLLLGVSHTSYGEQAGENPANLEQMTVTASRIEQPIKIQSSSLSVVSQQEIERVSAVHISELLNRVQGVWITRGNGQEHLTALRSPVLTGAGSCGAFYIAEDGIPVRPTGFCNVNQLFDLNTEQAQRIEVLRGPGTALHSSDALHGVINVISEKPSPEGETSIGLEAGPNDYGRVKFSVSDSHGQSGYRINFNGASDGGYHDDSGFDQQKLTLRLDYQGNNWSSQNLISANNLNQETAGYIVGTDAYKDAALRDTNPNPEAYRDSQAVRWQSRIRFNTNNDNLIIVTPYARYSEMNFLMHFLPGKPAEENGQTSAGVQTTYRKPINDALILTQGIDVEFTDAYLKQSQAQADLWFLPTGKQYDYEVEAQVFAGYLNFDYQLTDSISTSFGGRYEFLEYDYDNRMISGNTQEDGNACVNATGTATGCRYTRPEDRSDDFENLSANAGMIYFYSDELITSARLSHGFRAPQATELYRLQSGQLIAELDSEEINSIEVAVKGNVNDIRYDFTGFYMSKNNVIFQSTARENLDNGKTQHQGLEYLLFWDINDQWAIGSTGTFARHTYEKNVTTPGSGEEFQTNGNDIISAPRRTSSVQLNWLPSERTQVELQWVAMGKYYTDLENLHYYEGHNLVHLRLRQQISNNINAGARLTNLTDKDYAERADFSYFAGDRYFVGQPRSLFVDVQLNF